MKEILRKIKHKFYYKYIQFFYNIEDTIKYLENKNLFIITSTGRTGTVLFSKIFNNIKGNYVVHEPLGGFEQYHHKLSLEDRNYSKKFIEEFRLKYIKHIILKNKPNCFRYGEVNGGLRQNIKEIKSLIPSTKIVHIVRNGKDVISSVLNRKSFLEGDVYFDLLPSEEIISHSKWKSMSRFEKICFMWNFENKYMREHADKTVKFELLVSDYDYFKSELLDFLDFDLSQEDWKKYVQKKENANKNVKESTYYENWSKQEKEFFIKTCKEEMNIYGYSI